MKAWSQNISIRSVGERPWKYIKQIVRRLLKFYLGVMFVQSLTTELFTGDLDYYCDWQLCSHNSQTYPPRGIPFSKVWLKTSEQDPGGMSWEKCQHCQCVQRMYWRTHWSESMDHAFENCQHVKLKKGKVNKLRTEQITLSRWEDHMKKPVISSIVVLHQRRRFKT
jgi:hypothetical protein